MSATSRWRPSRKSLISGGLLIGAVVLVMGLNATRPAPALDTTEETRFSVETVRAELQSLHPELELVAQVSSVARPTLTAASAAEVLRIAAREGQKVARNDILIELDPRDAEVQLRQAQAELAQAEAAQELQRVQAAADRENLERERQLASLSESELARLIRLRGQGVIAETTIDQAKQNHQRNLLTLAAREQAVQAAGANAQQTLARLQAAEAAVQNAELALERTLIRAPFPAVVSQVLVETGARVSPGQALMAIYDADRLEFVVDLPTRHLPALQRSLGSQQPAQGRVEYGGAQFAVVLDRIGAEASSGAVRAWLRLQEPAILPLDVQLTVRLQLPAVAAAVAIPESGLYDLGRVFRIEDGRLQSLAVTVHGTQRHPRGMQVVITHPELAAGDELLASNLANAVSGLAVQTLDR